MSYWDDLGGEVMRDASYLQQKYPRGLDSDDVSDADSYLAANTLWRIGRICRAGKDVESSRKL